MIKWLLSICGFTLTIAAASLTNPCMYEGNIGLCYGLFLASGTLAIATASLLVAGEIGLSRAFAFLTLQAICLVATCAAIYAGYGYLTPDGTTDTGSLAIGAYFSIVTWTTLGYGDFQPHPDIRMIAAGQALFGYLFLGLIVGSVSSLLGKSHTKR